VQPVQVKQDDEEFEVRRSEVPVVSVPAPPPTPLPVVTAPAPAPQQLPAAAVLGTAVLPAVAVAAIDEDRVTLILVMTFPALRHDDSAVVPPLLLCILATWFFLAHATHDSATPALILEVGGSRKKPEACSKVGSALGAHR